MRARGNRAVAALLQICAVLVSAHVVAEEEPGHAERKGVGVEEETAALELPALLPETGEMIDLYLDRSMFIRSPALLAGISFEDLLNQLAGPDGSGDGRALFRQWWSTLGEGTDEQVAAGLACPAAGSSEQPPGLNPFPMVCDPLLARIAHEVDPFAAGSETPFIIIAAVNRIDLRTADQDSPDCGEYRLIAAANPGWSGWGAFSAPPPRIFAIFESVVPDGAGDGKLCRAIQWFWARFSNRDGFGNLTADADIARELRRFFLEGGKLTPDGKLVDNNEEADGAFILAPAMSAANLGGDSNDRRGQVRVNTLTGNLWVLREFEFRDGGDGPRLSVVPMDGAADPSLFVEDAPNGAQLADVILSSPHLLDPNVNTFHFLPGHGVEATQMIMPAQGGSAHQSSYSRILGNPPYNDDDVRQAIQDLVANTEFSFPNVAKRLEILSCAGCHHHVQGAKANMEDDQGRPVKWPASLGFTHIIEEPAADGRYPISKTLTCVLLPHRAKVMGEQLGVLVHPLPDVALVDGCRHFYY